MKKRVVVRSKKTTIKLKAGDIAVVSAPRRSKTKPRVVERIEQETAQIGKSYEEAKWAYLSPEFRKAHNKMRVLRGMEPIPPPKKDLYVAPQRSRIAKIDLNSKEIITAAREFLGPTLMVALDAACVAA